MQLDITDLTHEVYHNGVSTINIEKIKEFNTFSSELLNSLKKAVSKAMWEDIEGDSYDDEIRVIIPYWDEELVLVENDSIIELYSDKGKVIFNKLNKILKLIHLDSYIVIKVKERNRIQKEKGKYYSIPFPKEGMELKHETGVYDIKLYMSYLNNNYYKITKIEEFETPYKKSMVIETEIMVKIMVKYDKRGDYGALIHKLEGEIKSIDVNDVFEITDCNCHGDCEDEDEDEDEDEEEDY